MPIWDFANMLQSMAVFLYLYLPHTYIICASHHKLFINGLINSIFSFSELHKNSSNIYLNKRATFLIMSAYYINMNKTIKHVV